MIFGSAWRIFEDLLKNIKHRAYIAYNLRNAKIKNIKKEFQELLD